MVDLANIQNISAVARTAALRQSLAGKKESGAVGVGPAGASADMVQISADAALKGKLGAFSAALAKETAAPDTERIARLKEAYAGDACPVSACELAGALLGRIRTLGFANE